jgi:dTDP-glucose 4,6-dehydratase
VDDHNKSILEITEGGRAGYRYNIGSKVEKTNLEMIELIINKINPKCDNIEPYIEFVIDRKGHDFRYAIDSLHYRRQFELIDFENGMDETINFYINKYKK